MKALWNQIIQSTKEKNSALFWKLISSHSYKENTPIGVFSLIASDKWEVFFWQLHTDHHIYLIGPLIQLMESSPSLASLSEVKHCV